MHAPTLAPRPSPPPHPQRVHLIAGASGVGTSTRAAELARTWAADPHARRVHIIATDVVRAQLRTALPRDTHPDLFGESFNLSARPGDRLRDGVSISAFERQCAPILTAVIAGIDYALTEGWDVIAEGVHLLPDALPLQLASSPAALVTVELLTVPDEAEHITRLRSRDAASDGRRPAAHYEANLARVRAIQAELIERHAARANA